MQEKVLVAVSGGVDSAVAAALLLQAGYDVTAVFLCLQMERASVGNERSCCSPQDAADARQVASRLGIPFQVLSVAEDFSAIIDRFVEDYENGRTPNPCIRCNERVKFRRLFELADSVGARYVATGHYARIADYRRSPAVVGDPDIMPESPTTAGDLRSLWPSRPRRTSPTYSFACPESG